MAIYVAKNEQDNKPISEVKSPLSKLDVKSIKEVVKYLATNPTVMSKDLEYGNGPFMASLVKRGYLNIVGKEEQFIQLDHSEYFRKLSVNIYGPTQYTENLFNDWVEDYITERFDKPIAEYLNAIECAKQHIEFFKHMKAEFLSQF